MVNIEPPSDLPDHHTSEFRSAYRECIIPKNENFDFLLHDLLMDSYVSRPGVGVTAVLRFAGVEWYFEGVNPGGRTPRTGVQTPTHQSYAAI